MPPFQMTQDFTAARAPKHTGAVPAQSDVVVIGGGIIGIMTAWFLQRSGQSVTVLEKGHIAGEQSSRNWGWVRQQGRHLAELPIMMESLRIWRDLGQEVGQDLGFRQHGIAYIAQNAQQLAAHENWLASAHHFGLDSRILTGTQLSALIPAMARQFPGALYTPSDARAEPWIAVPRIAASLAARGAVIRENCAVRGLDIAAGRVGGVVTAQGRIAADRVVLAGGAWSSLLLRRHGVTVPQLSVKASVLATKPTTKDVFAGGAEQGRVAFRRRLDGGYTLAPSFFHELMLGPDAFRHLKTYLPMVTKDYRGTRFLPVAPAGYPDSWTTPRSWAFDTPSPFEATPVLNPEPNHRKLRGLLEEFTRLFPALSGLEIHQGWAGMIDLMPDEIPILDHVPALPGLCLATGMTGHGFGIGPGIGRVMADLVTGRDPGHDLRPFAFDRFG